MSEDYTGPDFSSQNASQTDKAANAQTAANEAGAKAAAGAKQQNQQTKADKSAAIQKSNGVKAQGFAAAKAALPAPGSVETTSPALQTSLGPMPTAHTGGDVTKTGLVDVKQGEKILNPSQASEYRNVFKSRAAAGKHNWK